MQASEESVAIIGASGNVGFHVLSLASDACGSGELKGKIKAVSRDPDQLKQRLAQSSQGSDASNLEFVHGDVTKPDTLDAILHGVKRVFLCLPQSLTAGQMVDVTKAFVDLAVRQGVRHVVRVSSYGIDDHLQGKEVSQGPLGDAHVAGEEYTVTAGLCDMNMMLLVIRSWDANQMQ
jgi:uncharacterized protein YbjT (DUF2867 family)